MLSYNQEIMGIREEQNMGNYTNEKSLIVVQDNFLNKVKKFFAKAFWNRKSKYYMEENENEYFDDDYEETSEVQENVKKKRKLYNFDADDNDDWPGDVNMEIINDENDDVSKDVNNSDDDIDNQNQEEIEEEYDGEIYSEAYIEKKKLEKKLMNYYESIKKIVNLNKE